MTVKILAFDGSGRKNSINRNIMDHVITKAKECGGVEITQINLMDYDLPFYNGDLEAEHGLPKGVQELKELFRAHDGFLIASPEYNGSFTPLLKNALDWVSRPEKDKPTPFQGKVAGLVTASGGKLGGLRNIYQLNTLLFTLGTMVLPNIVSIGFYNDAIDENNTLKNENEQRAVDTLARRLTEITAAIK